MKTMSMNQFRSINYNKSYNMYNSYHLNQSIMRNTFMVLTLVISVLLPSKALATGIDFQVKNVTVREAVLKLQQQKKVSIPI